MRESTTATTFQRSTSISTLVSLLGAEVEVIAAVGEMIESEPDAVKDVGAVEAEEIVTNLLLLVMAMLLVKRERSLKINTVIQMNT